MITNDRQYKIAKSQVLNFQQSLDSLTLTPSEAENIHPKLLEAHRNAVVSQLQEMLLDISEYEALKEGRIVITEVNDLKELPLILIKSRIANGFTQAELARNLGMKEQQLQRYESEKYESASLKTLLKIAEYLKLNLKGDVQIKEIVAPDFVDVKNYPFKQMFQRKWFSGFAGSLNDAVKESSSLIGRLFEEAGLKNLQFSLTKKYVRAGSTLNKYALNIWYARIIIKAKNSKPKIIFDKKIITDTWLKNLAALSKEDNGPAKAVEYLNNSGIGFVIEPQLDGTFLDGAALLLDDVYPIIALTLRYDRLDNFWFVLFHEIAHIHLHLGGDLDAIFDDLDAKIDGIEEEADKFALNALIPDNLWRKSLARFSPTNKTIINQAESLQVHPALIAGRIRRETGHYHLFNDLIGQGKVRINFTEQLQN